MCGFTLHIFEGKVTNDIINKCIRDSFNISHRGPDNFRFEYISKINAVICFYRLSINDTSVMGNQPFIRSDKDGEYYLVCNGEFYNHIEMEKSIESYLESRSDCEFIINELMENGMKPKIELYNSEHSFVGLKIKNYNSYEIVASTDRFSIRPLFTSKFTINGIKGVGFSSELEGLTKFENFEVERFNSSCISYNGEIERYYNVRNIRVMKKEEITFEEASVKVREALIKSVKMRLMSERKIGFFLSGGLDSVSVCISAIIAYRELGIETQINTYSIGYPGSDDEIYARKASLELGTNHKHFTLTKERYLSLINKVIECTCSYDTTTVRASIGQLECSRLVSEDGMVVMLSGDGSDELFFSYNDVLHCPDYERYLERVYHYLENIHKSDGLRVDRCVSFYGMEARLPFLDVEFVNLILSLPVEYRFPINGVTKPLLRNAFRGHISDEIIDRPKVTFSDGVGNKNDQSRTVMVNHFKTMYSKKEFERLSEQFSYHCKPTTNEELYYRIVFSNFFGYEHTIARTIDYWKPVFGRSDDPSAWYTQEVLDGKICDEEESYDGCLKNEKIYTCVNEERCEISGVNFKKEDSIGPRFTYELHDEMRTEVEKLISEFNKITSSKNDLVYHINMENNKEDAIMMEEFGKIKIKYNGPPPIQVGNYAVFQFPERNWWENDFDN